MSIIAPVSVEFNVRGIEAMFKIETRISPVSHPDPATREWTLVSTRYSRMPFWLVCILWPNVGLDYHLGRFWFIVRKVERVDDYPSGGISTDKLMRGYKYRND